MRWKDLLYRVVVAAFAVVMRVTRGRLPFGVSFVPDSQRVPLPPLPPVDSQQSSSGATSDAQGQLKP